MFLNKRDILNKILSEINAISFDVIEPKFDANWRLFIMVIDIIKHIWVTLQVGLFSIN